MEDVYGLRKEHEELKRALENKRHQEELEAEAQWLRLINTQMRRQLRE